ncbi:MAG: IS200/IS605 family transposase [Syntrophothermus sp.]
MGSYTSIFYHIVFSTKNRNNTIKAEFEKRIYNYIWEVIKDKKCKLIRIGGTENHIHILLVLHPDQSLSELIRVLKCNSTNFIKKNIDNKFEGWQEGYSAFTVDAVGKDYINNYIINQKEHHKKISFVDEVKNLLQSAKIVFDEKYL